MNVDDLAIPILLVVVGLIRVVPQLVMGGPWGGEPTVAAIALALGVLSLATGVLRREETAP